MKRLFKDYIPLPMLERIKHVLIVINRHIIPPVLSRMYYGLAVRSFVGLTCGYSNIKSIYLRNSFAAGDWVPWDSDIDFTIVIHATSPLREGKFLKGLWRRIGVLSVMFPVIGHIDIFKDLEFERILASKEPQFSHLVKNLKLAYGQEAKTKVAQQINNIYSFRVSDCQQYIRWFYNNRLEEKSIYLRRCYNFFKKISDLDMLRRDNYNALIAILGQIKSSYYTADNPQQLLCKAWYHSLHILGDIQITENFTGDEEPTYTYIDIPDKALLADINQPVTRFIDGLSEYDNQIESVFATTPSLMNNYHKLWIVLKPGCDEENACSILKQTKRNYKILAKNMVTPYVITENALNTLLNTQRTWAFEYFHILHNSILIKGKNILGRLAMPSRGIIRTSARNSIIIYKNMVYSHDFSNPSIILFILSLKPLFDKNYVLTSKKAVTGVYEESYGFGGIKTIKDFINGRKVSQTGLFLELAAFLDSLYAEQINKNILQEKEALYCTKA